MSTKLLAVSADAKTIKGEKFGVITGILYLAPVNLSGYQVCPKASEGCKAACLFTAGRGIYTKVQNARIAKTKRFFEDRVGFMNDIVKDIEFIIRKADKLNLAPAIRLNGTSDIAWEKMAVVRNGITYRNVMVAFPNVTFYDYTKVLGRKGAANLKNYHLTFSLSESNDKDARKAIAEGYNVSVVLNVGRTKPLPAKWSGFNLIDGDTSDIRFNDGSGNMIGLRAKGKARKDTSGFVRSIHDTLR